MALKSWQQPTYKLKLPIPMDVEVTQEEIERDYTVTLRGLSTPDIIGIVDKHRDVFAMLTGIFVAEGKGIPMDDFASVAQALMGTAPTLVGDIIAYSANEPDAGPTATNLPAGVQIEALEQIGNLTFIMAGGPKKVVEIVIRILEGMTSFVGKANALKAKSLST